MVVTGDVLFDWPLLKRRVSFQLFWRKILPSSAEKRLKIVEGDSRPILLLATGKFLALVLFNTDRKRDWGASFFLPSSLA